MNALPTQENAFTKRASGAAAIARRVASRHRVGARARPRQQSHSTHNRRPRDQRRLAAEFAEQGRHAEARREWLRAAVRTIEDRGILPPRPGRTGAATAREAGPSLPAAADDLRAATAAFDEVWFGGRAATPADVALARSAADGVGSARVAQPVATAGYTPPW